MIGPKGHGNNITRDFNNSDVKITLQYCMMYSDSSISRCYLDPSCDAFFSAAFCCFNLIASASLKVI